MESIGYFVLGVVLLLLGGDSMTKGVSGLGQRLGLSPFLAGLLLLSVASSLPALAVNAYALHAGATDLALGNAIGSNVVNLGLTLGLAALAAPLVVQRRGTAGELVFIVVATGAVMFTGVDGVIGRGEGLVLLAGFALVLVHAFTRGRDEADAVRQELADFAETRTGLTQNLVRIAIATAVLYFGAKFVVAGAPALGAALGMDALLTGLTVVAIGTSLPMTVVAVMAARNGQGNVVVGQALGGSLVNLLLVVGGLAAIRPLSVPATFVEFALPAAMAMALVLSPVLGGDLRITRREGGLLLAMFAVWLTAQVAWFGA